MALDIAQALNENGIEDKIQRLLFGLDWQSIQCVNTILARLKSVMNVKDKRISCLTRQEIQTLQIIESEFYPRIICFENSYFYNGFFLPKSDYVQFEISVFWHKHSLHRIENQEKMIDKNIIDVGGYIGDSALILQQYTQKKVYSFEALSDNYDLMRQTITLNNANRIIPIKKALGAKFEKVKIARYGAGSSIVVHHNQDFEEVEVITLDSFVQEHNLEVGFIKVDIEGFEMSFLQGALETIKSQKPAMLVSIYHQASDFFGIKPFLEDLNLGYTFKVHKPIDGSVSGETCLFCEIIKK